MRLLVISMFLYACKSGTFTAELEKGRQAFEMRCCRRVLGISYKDRKTIYRFSERFKQPFMNMLI